MKRILLLIAILPFIFGFNGYYRTHFYGANPYAGDVTNLNTDPEFEALTTGTSYPITTVTAANPPFCTLNEGSNLTLNPEFTTDLTSWSVAGLISHARVDSTTDPGTVSGGVNEYCLKVTSTSAGSYGYSRQGIAVSVGVRYRIKAKLYSPSSNTSVNATRLRLRNYANQEYSVTPTTTEDTWQTVTVYITATDTTLYVGCGFSGAALNDVAYMDSVEIYPAHGIAENNYITINGVTESQTFSANNNSNPEFTTNTASWYGSAGATLARVDSTTDPGTVSGGTNAYCLKVTNASTSQGGATNASLGTVEVGALYKVTALLYSPSTNTQSDAAKLGIYNAAYVPYTTLLTTVEDSWVQVSAYVRPTSTTMILRVVFIGGTVGDVVYADSVNVQKINPVQSIPYRVTNVADNTITIDADFSGVSAAVTSGYCGTISLDNYTLGDGWGPFLDVDFTPITSGALTSGTLYSIQSTETDHFFVGCKIGDVFTCSGSETCDASNTVYRITETYLKCDGSQTSDANVYISGISSARYVGYNTTLSIDVISAGKVTPIVGNRSGSEITTIGDKNQRLRAVDTGGFIGISADESCITQISSLQVGRYR